MHAPRTDKRETHTYVRRMLFLIVNDGSEVRSPYDVNFSAQEHLSDFLDLFHWTFYLTRYEIVLFLGRTVA